MGCSRTKTGSAPGVIVPVRRARVARRRGGCGIGRGRPRGASMMAILVGGRRPTGSRIARRDRLAPTGPGLIVAMPSNPPLQPPAGARAMAMKSRPARCARRG
jgi:hypothetical protein